VFNIGFAELLVILLVAFVIVGPKDLPKVARALGRWVKMAKNMYNDFKSEMGLDETADELAQVKRDLDKTIREADPSVELRKIGRETQQSLREAEQAVRAKKPPVDR